MVTPLFPIGQLVATPGALSALAEAEEEIGYLLIRHISGDWGNVPTEDAVANNEALENGFRILSSYQLSTGEKIWVITEADRGVTTFLLPSEY